MPRFDITIAGELNLDLILYGLPEQLAPERELLADRMMLTLGSSSAIVAHNLAALGSRVGFQSRIGEDQLGQMALERLEQGGVDVSLVRRVSGSITTGLTVILYHEGWRNILTYMGTISELSWDDLDLSYLSDSRHFHFSSYYLQRALRPRVADLFQHLKSKGLTISLDTNDDPDDRWEGGLHQILQSGGDARSGSRDWQAFSTGTSCGRKTRPQGRSCTARQRTPRQLPAHRRCGRSGRGRRQFRRGFPPRIRARVEPGKMPR
jgi:pfkB family carbohydrate kinase